MSKKFTVTVQDHETNETKTVEVEGFVFIGIKEREDRDAYKGVQWVSGVSADEMARMTVSLEQDFPAIRKAKMMGMLGAFMEKMTEGSEGEDVCNCPKCTARREEEAANASENN